ncbi:NAD(P)-binding domain-containing protein [Streptomyces fradiae]|uniref:NAD(P)-binding domain-containing protein n=1 Tax=Streptomyces fradiae TaxID=1906 RepID=UPI0035BE5065
MTENGGIQASVPGLGSMGGALAEALTRAGHGTTVWNRTPGRADALAAHGAREARLRGTPSGPTVW